MVDNKYKTRPSYLLGLILCFLATVMSYNIGLNFKLLFVMSARALYSVFLTSKVEEYFYEKGWLEDPKIYYLLTFSIFIFSVDYWAKDALFKILNWLIIFIQAQV